MMLPMLGILSALVASTKAQCALGEYEDSGWFFSDCYLCSEGYYCPDGEHQEPCQVGHYCPAGSAEMTPCPAGTYNYWDASGAIDDCYLCPSGSFCPEASANPIPCPFAGFTGNYTLEGLASEAECEQDSVIETTTEMPPPFTTEMVTSVYVKTTEASTEVFDTTTDFFTSETPKFSTEPEGTTRGIELSTTEFSTDKTYGPEETSVGPEHTTTKPTFTTAEPCPPSMICPEADFSSIVDLINAQSQTLQEILQLAQSNQARLEKVEQQIGNFSCQATINLASEMESNSTSTALSSPINDNDENEAAIIQAKRDFINDIDLLKATFPTFDDLETWDAPKVFEEIELCVTSALSNCYNNGGSQSLAKIGAMFPGVTDFATVENLISGYSAETQTWMVGAITKQCSGQFSNAAGSANNKYKAVKTTNYQCVTYLEKMFHARLQEFGL